MFITKRYHDLALKKLALYLKNTQERVLVLDPNYDIFKVDAYPNDYFSVMNGHKRHDDTECAKSRTGFIIMFADFPVLWISKLQNETTLYKTKIEIFIWIIVVESCFRYCYSSITWKGIWPSSWESIDESVFSQGLCWCTNPS